MNEYYYNDGQQNNGPFKIGELKNKNITRETLIWCEGMRDWVKAQDIEELKFLFTSIPPLIKNIAPPPVLTSVNNNKTVKAKSKSKIIRNIIIISISIIVIAVAIILILNNKSDNNSISSSSSSNSSNSNNSSYEEQPKPKTEAELKTDLKLTEESNPLKYLSVTGQWKLNFYNETVIEVDIFNSAALATFKDVKIKVEFLSKTKTVLGTGYFTVYDYIYPSKSVHFKQKFTYYYKESKSISFNLVDAEVSK
jgi:hypothetical protein